MRAMKAQMIFEFIVATVIFFGIVFYIINILNVNVVSFGTDFYSNTLQNKVVQSSEHLIKNVLALDWPVLDRAELDNIPNECIDYDHFLNLLDLTEKSYGKQYNISIQIDEEGGGSWSCSSPGITGIPNITKAGIKRFALSDDGDIITLEFWIW